MPERWLTFPEIAAAIFEENRTATKEQFAELVARRLDLTRDRSVFVADDLAVRFAYASRQAFSNTVVSFANIKKYDERPFLVCVLRPDGVETLLANASLIAKVTHSSQTLTVTNIRGSILGTDILRELNGLANAPPNFEALFARHLGLPWEDNLERLVEATTGILPRGEKYAPTNEEQARILGSVREAGRVVTGGELEDAARRLYATVEEQQQAILRAAVAGNGNLRGNAIEQLITGAGNRHDLGDQIFALARGGRLIGDVKSKLRGRASSPKLYNVDKMLRALADGQTVFAALFVGVDLLGQRVTARLVNVFDEALLGATGVQHHWAGRGSRGVTQLGNCPERIFEADFQPHVDVEAAERFVRGLIAR
jgi:hypothetical protein